MISKTIPKTNQKGQHHLETEGNHLHLNNHKKNRMKTTKKTN